MKDFFSFTLKNEIFEKHLIYARYNGESFIVCTKNNEDIKKVCSKTYYLEYFTNNQKTVHYSKKNLNFTIFYSNNTWSVQKIENWMICNFTCKIIQYMQNDIRFVPVSYFLFNLLPRTDFRIASREFGNFYLPIMTHIETDNDGFISSMV